MRNTYISKTSISPMNTQVRLPVHLNQPNLQVLRLLGKYGVAIKQKEIK
jgi:hypothetical protein